MTKTLYLKYKVVYFLLSLFLGGERERVGEGGEREI